MKLVFIRWEDACTHVDTSWIHKENFIPQKILVCRSVGWLVHEDAESYEICQSVAGSASDQEQWNNFIAIPKNCVLQYVEIDHPYSPRPEKN
jgi:hypothetical protein